VTGGVRELAHRARAGPTKSHGLDPGHRATLRGDDAGSGWRRGTNRVTTQGRRCRQRLFGVAVDSDVWKLGRRFEGKHEAGRGGRKGESLKLGGGVFRRILVTTSRLQRSRRGIFSWTNGGASAPSGRHE
jgi:hypothetical protein